MKVVRDLAELERGRPAILTIGAFDGVHRGHQFLIRQVVGRARRLDYDSAIITFDPRPEVVFRPESTQLTDAAAKARIIAAMGPDILAILKFNREVAQVTAGQFLLSILDHINLGEIWVGADFAFGHNREGTVDFLIRSGAAAGFAVHVLPREKLSEVPLSSTLVRDLLTAGNVAAAAVYLGHYAGFSGPVVRGAGRGRALGFPTANIQPPPHQALPATGIYAAYVRLGGERLPAAASVGYNPQFEGHELTVEAYILDFDRDIYGEELGIEFVGRVREERKFDSVDMLIAEMHRDIGRVREILAAAEEPGELLLGNG